MALLSKELIIIGSIILIPFYCHSQNRKTAHAAKTFLNALNTQQKEKTVFLFKDNERYNWHFIPRSRKGIPLKELSEKQKEYALNLLRSVTSDKGFEKSTGIIELEGILRDVEGRGYNDTYRDPGKYYISIFGDPSSSEEWGWRLEGHHLSLNFTSVTGKITAFPSFWGTNPAQVPQGPKKGWRILKDEEDLARTLVKSLNEEQLGEAWINKRAPRDIITGAQKKARLSEFTGIKASGLNQQQQSQLIELIETYLRNYKPEIVEDQMKNISKEKFHNLYFSWAGSLDPHQGHYYRIHSPELLIEYDNTQNNANHIHTVVRDLENDFGEDMLKKHYEEDPDH